MTTPRTRRDFLRLSLGSTLVLGAALAACGDDDDDQATGSSTTSTTSAGGGATTSTTALEVRPLTALMSFPLFLTFIVDVTSVAGGFQERNGVDLDLQFAQGAPQALQQLAAGNVPVAANAPLAIVQADSQQGGDFVAIATTMQESLYRLVSTEDRNIDTLRALEGMTVGFPTLGGNAEQTFNLLLQARDLSPDSVSRVAVGNDASSLAFVEEGRVDVIFGTLEAATGMRVAGLDAHIADIPEANPLLGYSLVARRETVDSQRDVLVGYLRAMHQSVTALLDPAQRAELLPQVPAQFDLPQLDEPDTANR
jgi:ABC-type nitrate/sulfonate/bicarbonate transport system substrate-binding protein